MKLTAYRINCGLNISHPETQAISNSNRMLLALAAADHCMAPIARYHRRSKYSVLFLKDIIENTGFKGTLFFISSTFRTIAASPNNIRATANAHGRYLVTMDTT